MVVYLSPQIDEAHMADLQRLSKYDVQMVDEFRPTVQVNRQMVVLVLGFRYATTVQQAVHLISHKSCKALLMPDDYHRHNDLIEHAKACAHHAGIPVMPLSRYLLKNPPAPEKQNPVHANPDQTGAGRGLPAAASAG
jgi:hypothetical protein